MCVSCPSSILNEGNSENITWLISSKHFSELLFTLDAYKSIYTGHKEDLLKFLYLIPIVMLDIVRLFIS